MILISRSTRARAGKKEQDQQEQQKQKSKSIKSRNSRSSRSRKAGAEGEQEQQEDQVGGRLCTISERNIFWQSSHGRRLDRQVTAPTLLTTIEEQIHI